MTADWPPPKSLPPGFPLPSVDKSGLPIAVGAKVRILSVASGASGLPREDQRTIGRDIAKVQFGWPIGLPLCRPLSGGLWEVRSSLPSKREARVFFGFYDGMLAALHAIIKKTQKTPANELTLARDRLKEMLLWPKRTLT